MSVVTLVSGGLDSTVMAALAREAAIEQHPLFVDYGQRSRARELTACRRAMRSLGLPSPRVANLGGFGRLIRSGLTDPSLGVFEDAFTPCRNMLFLLVAGAHAYSVGAEAVAIGLLDEASALFPDQTSRFLSEAESLLARCLGRPIAVLAPLGGCSKRDVVTIATAKRIRGTYSCHAGGLRPCGRCIACREFQFEEE